MAIMTISENFEIAIPEEMRSKLHLRPRVDLDQKNPDSFYWTGKL